MMNAVPSSTAPGTYVSITDFGAVADGTTDNQAAIQATLDYAAAHNVAAYVPSGDFAYSGTLAANGITVFGDGSSSVLSALDGANESLTLTGTGTSVSDLQLVGAGTTRLSTPWSDLIWAYDAQIYTVDNVLIQGGSNGGIMNDGSSGGLIENNTIENTQADSITSIDGASNITIQGNRILNSGDDGISVVSYVGVPIVHDITVQGNTILNNVSGRGISVVGGNNVKIVGNHVEGGPAGLASVYIAAESEYQTMGVDNVLVSGNTLINGGGAPDGTGQGAVTIYNSQGATYTLDNITVSGNQFVNPLSNPLQYVGDGSESGTVENNTEYANDPSSFSDSGNPSETFVESGNQVLGLSQYTTPLVPAGGGVGATPPLTGATSSGATGSGATGSGATGSGSAGSGSGGTPALPAASPNDTVIHLGSGQTISDGRGNVWGLNAGNGGEVTVSGTPDPATNGVTALAIVNGTVWANEASRGLWQYETAPSAGWQPGNAGGTTSPLPSTVSPTQAGTGPDVITLRISEDAYANGDSISDVNGDATFTVKVDGKQFGNTFTATAPHAAGLSQSFTISGYFGPGSHTVAVQFLNDAYNGKTYLDRNLYVGSVAYNGQDAHQSAALMSAGARNFTVSGGTAIAVRTAKMPAVTLDATKAQNRTVYGARISLTAPGTATVVLGSVPDTMQFMHMTSINMTAGPGGGTVTADDGRNTFTAGAGSLTVTGGSGAGAYIFHAGDRNLTINDFSLAKGDSLTIDRSLQTSVAETLDSQGGLVISFGAGSGQIHMPHVASLPTNGLRFA